MSATSRAFAIMELLAGTPEGLPLGGISSQLDIPQSATHRLLSELVDLGYLKRSQSTADYLLSMKSVTQSLSYLSLIDLVDLAKDSVDRIAAASRGLARLGIMDDESMVWVLRAQGSKSHVRYDPPMSYEVQLSSSASGFAWLAQLSDERALEIILRQGIATEGRGPNAPRTVDEVLTKLRETREMGYAVAADTYDEGITTVAVPIVNPKLERVTGVLSVANINVHMSGDTIAQLVPIMIEEAAALSEARLDYAKYLLPVKRDLP